MWPVAYSVHHRAPKGSFLAGTHQLVRGVSGGLPSSYSLWPRAPGCPCVGQCNRVLVPVRSCSDAARPSGLRAAAPVLAMLQCTDAVHVVATSTSSPKARSSKLLKGASYATCTALLHVFAQKGSGCYWCPTLVHCTKGCKTKNTRLGPAEINLLQVDCTRGCQNRSSLKGATSACPAAGVPVRRGHSGKAP